jgi:hypothetical protein
MKIILKGAFTDFVIADQLDKVSQKILELGKIDLAVRDLLQEYTFMIPEDTYKAVEHDEISNKEALRLKEEKMEAAHPNKRKAKKK